MKFPHDPAEVAVYDLGTIMNQLAEQAGSRRSGPADDLVLDAEDTTPGPVRRRCPHDVGWCLAGDAGQGD
ncbi:hypothetical protein H7H51_25860 [Mycolicibacterium farcinogenes]|nr:hypothetical protein [Mycolicibacterium farcinogenes]